jgi:hypothetical protein
VNGSFAEYVIGAAPYVGHLPEKADFAEMAPILCAGVTTYKGTRLSNLSSNTVPWPMRSERKSAHTSMRKWQDGCRHELASGPEMEAHSSEIAQAMHSAFVFSGRTMNNMASRRNTSR